MKSKKQRFLLATVMAFTLVFGCVENVNAMHIMEGYLPLKYCLIWGVMCIPFLVFGLLSIQKTVEQNRKALMILVMMGAYAFVLSALKIPSVTGSSSHPTGTGLGAILFGPTAMCVIGVIILLFQAILLAHGGLTTLGANTFSMAIAGPFLAYAIYHLSKKLNISKHVGVFLATGLSDLFTYSVTAFQLALAHPSEVGGFQASFVEFLGIFAGTQVPLAFIEGLLAVVVMKGLEAYARPELTELRYLEGRN